MCFVVMTQPAWPGIFPPDPAVVGHALLVNKDFIEMLAAVGRGQHGRWGAGAGWTTSSITSSSIRSSRKTMGRGSRRKDQQR